LTEIVRNSTNHTARRYQFASNAAAQLLQVRAKNAALSSARRPRALPKRLMILLAVVMNAVVVAEAESADAALRVEVKRLAYIIIPDVGSRNWATEPTTRNPLVMRIIR
jgi:hypothetical protein